MEWMTLRAPTTGLYSLFPDSGLSHFEVTDSVKQRKEGAAFLCHDLQHHKFRYSVCLFHPHRQNGAKQAYYCSRTKSINISSWPKPRMIKVNVFPSGRWAVGKWCFASVRLRRRKCLPTTRWFRADDVTNFYYMLARKVYGTCCTKECMDNWVSVNSLPGGAHWNNDKHVTLPPPK